MKIAALISLLLVGGACAFVAPSNVVREQSTKLMAEVDRRRFAGIAFSAATATFLGVSPSVAAIGGRGADYVPKFKDLKQIYDLGVSLDRLVGKFQNEDTIEAGLEGVRMFNRDPNFYPGYAKNYISKSVLNNADADPRLGYVRQACKLVGSTESVIAGDSGLIDTAATEEAIKRVKKAQTLIAKFLAESGVEDESLAAFVAAHP